MLVSMLKDQLSRLACLGRKRSNMQESSGGRVLQVRLFDRCFGIC